MENISNVSSEEDLLQLRNEGKISEEEYEDLLETLRKTGKVSVGQETITPVRTSGLAIASLILSIASLVLFFIGSFTAIPAIICGHLARREIRKNPNVRGHGLALAGLIVGYVFLSFFIIIVIIGFSMRLGYVIIRDDNFTLEFRPEDNQKTMHTRTIHNQDGFITECGSIRLEISDMKLSVNNEHTVKSKSMTIYWSSKATLGRLKSLLTIKGCHL